MNSRERLLATLGGQCPDRVPVAPFVQEEYLSFYYPQKSSLDRVIDAVELANELDFDLMAKHRALERPHFLRRSFPNWDLRQTQDRGDGMIRRRIEITTPDRTLIREETGPESGAATGTASSAAWASSAPPSQSAMPLPRRACIAVRGTGSRGSRTSAAPALGSRCRRRTRWWCRSRCTPRRSGWSRAVPR